MSDFDQRIKPLEFLKIEDGARYLVCLPEEAYDGEATDIGKALHEFFPKAHFVVLAGARILRQDDEPTLYRAAGQTIFEDYADGKVSGYVSYPANAVDEQTGVADKARRIYRSKAEYDAEQRTLSIAR